MKLKSLLIFSLPLVLLLSGCQDSGKDEIAPKDTELAGVNVAVGENKSSAKLFVLSQGQMGKNNGSLGFLRYSDGKFVNNAFAQMNPSITQGLGDVANDMQISYDYGNRLWIAVDKSGIVEVLNPDNEVELTNLDIPEPRHIAFSKKSAFVTSYVGQKVGEDMTGSLYKIDFKEIDNRIRKQEANANWTKIDVGYYPEGVAVYNEKVYVANGGGLKKDYSYDNRLMEIDAASFKVTNTIEVVKNIQKIFISNNGIAWLTSPGDYFSVHSGIYPVDLKTKKVLERSEALAKVRVSCICFDKQSQKLYAFGTNDEWDWNNPNNKYHLYIIDTNNSSVTVKDFNAKVAPYAVGVNPDNGDLYVTDAKGCTRPGSLHCFDTNLKEKWVTNVGVCPGSILYYKKK